MEEFLKYLVDTFPVAATLYLGLSGGYAIFCAVASFTTNKRDDEIANNTWVRRFFSLPAKKS